MLLTLTTTHEPATDLGYLLHKNPSRIQTEELSFGKAHVFYPEAESTRCTAAVLLEVDPVGLVRGRGPLGEGGLLEGKHGQSLCMVCHFFSGFHAAFVPPRLCLKKLRKRACRRHVAIALKRFLRHQVLDRRRFAASWGLNPSLNPTVN